MRKSTLLLLPLTIVVGPVVAQSADPEGWTALVNAIGEANPNSPDALRGRQFVLALPSAGPEDTIEVGPQQAFSVERISNGRFRVTITNPAALVDSNQSSPGTIRDFEPISWKIAQIGITGFGAAIEGSATCKYHVRFRQKGGNDLSLAALDADYNVTHELSRPSVIATIDRDDRGLLLTRNAGSVEAVSIRLRAKAKTGPRDYSTAWIVIPSCESGVSATVPIPVPSPTPTPPSQTVAQCMSYRTVGINQCTEKCGEQRIVLSIEYSNVCSRPIRCEPLNWSLSYGDQVHSKHEGQWVQLNDVGTTNFDVTLPARAGASPFRISGPNASACRFL